MKEYPKEVYDFEDYLNDNNIEYHLEGDTFVITHKGDLYFGGINNFPDNIDFRNNGYVDLTSIKYPLYNVRFNNNGYVYLPLKKLSESIEFNNNGFVRISGIKEIPENITFNNKGDIWLYDVKYLPDNKYEIFKNDGIVHYDENTKEFDPRKGLESKLSFKEYPKEVYDFEDYLNDNNIEYHLEGDTFVITHKGDLYFGGINNLPNNIDFRNDGYIYLTSIKYLPDNIRFNNNGNVDLYSLEYIPKNITFNNKGDIYLDYIKYIPKSTKFNNNGDIYLDYIKSLPDNKYEIFKNDGIVYYDENTKKFDPRKGLEDKLSFKEYPKEVYDFEDYLNDNNIEYHLEGDTFVITHKGDLDIVIDTLPDNIDFRNNGYVDLTSIKYPLYNVRFNNNGYVYLPLKKLSESIEFNNNGFVRISGIKEIPENITFTNKGNVCLYSVKSIPDNKYEIFKNNGIVYYNKYTKWFDPRKGLESKLSFKEYTKEVYDFEEYLNKHNIEYHLEGDTFVITHRGNLGLTNVDNLPDDIDFRNDGYVDIINVKYLPNNIKFNNNGTVVINNIVGISNSVKFNNNGFVNIPHLKEIPKNITFNNNGDIFLYSVKSIPDNKYEIFKNDGVVYYNHGKSFIPKDKLENKISFKEYPKEVYDFEDFLNKNNIEYHLEGDTFVITHKGDLNIGSIDNIPDNIDFRNYGYVDIINVKELPNNIKFNNNGYVSFPFLKKLSESTEFNNSGDVDLYSLEYIPKSTKFNNTGNIFLYYIKSLPYNKYEIFKNDGIVYYDENIKKFDPRKGLESKLSFKEYPKEVYDFEDYLNDNNIEYHLEGDTFVITHKGSLMFDDIKHIPKDIDFINNGHVYIESVNELPENIKFNNNGHVSIPFLKKITENIEFNNDGDVHLNSLIFISKNITFNNKGNVSLNYLKSLSENIEFNNNGFVDLYSLENIPENITFNNKDDIFLYSIKSIPNNKYEIFKNDGVVYYDENTKEFDPRKGLESKLSFKEYPKEVYDFEDYLNDNNIEYHLEGDTFVITHKGNLYINSIDNIPDNIDFRNDGHVRLPLLKDLPNNIKFNNNGNVSFSYLKEITKNITFNNNGDIFLYSVKSIPDNKYEIFKNNGIVYYNKYTKWFDPRKGLESKLSFKEYTKEVYDFEDYLNKRNIEYHLEGDTFVITDKSTLYIINIDNLPDNIDFRNDGHVYIEFIKRSPENVKFNNNGKVSLYSLKNLSDSIEFNNNGDVTSSSIKEIPKSIKFNNKGDIWVYSIKSLPDNKYEIFKNDGIVYYDKYTKQFDPRKGLESKLSFKEYPKEVYDFEDYLNKRNIEYHLEGDTFVITHKGDLYINSIDNFPDNIDFRNDGFVYADFVKELPENIKFNNNSYVSFPFLKKLSENIEFNNNGDVYLPLKKLSENIKFNNKGDVCLYFIKSLPDNKYEIFKNDGIVSYDKYTKWFDPREGLESKLSFKEYPKEVYDFEDYLNDNNIEYHLEGDTFVITHKGDLVTAYITFLPDNIDFRNDGDIRFWNIEHLSGDITFNNTGEVFLDNTISMSKNVTFNNKGSVILDAIKYLPENVNFSNNGSVGLANLIDLHKSVKFNNNGDVTLPYLKEIPENITFNNKGNVWLYSIKSLPDNKYEIFKNDGFVYYGYVYRKPLKEFDPREGLESKLSFKEYPKEVYDFEEYLNKHNIEYHLKGDTFVITHKGNLIFDNIKYIPKDIDFRNDGFVSLLYVKRLPENIKFNNNGDVVIDNIVDISNSVKFNNNGDIFLYSINQLPENKYEMFNNNGIVYYSYDSLHKILKKFNSKDNIENKLSFKEYPKEVYDFEDYLNKYNIEYHLEGDTFVITHKDNLTFDDIKYIPDNINFRNDGFVNFVYVKQLSENITFNNKGNVWLYSIKSLPNNKYEIFKNDGIVYYNKYTKWFDPRKGLESKLSFKEYPKEVYNFEDYLNKRNIEYHLEGDTFVITHKGDLNISRINNLPDNIDFRNDGSVIHINIKYLPNNIKFNNNGYVSFPFLKKLSESIEFNNNGNVDISYLKEIPKNITFNNNGDIYLDSIKSLPDNKYEIFKNDGIVYYDYDGPLKEFDPREGLESKLSFKEYPKEVYDFEEYLNDNNIEYHLEGDTFVITHKGDLVTTYITFLPDNIDFRNDGFVDIINVKELPNNIKFNNNGYVSFSFLKKLSESTEFNNSGEVDLYSLENIPENITFNNKGDIYLYSVKDLPNNKYEIFKNDGIVYYNKYTKWFDPRKGLESKLSFKEYPKEVYNFEDYLNKHNIEYHLEGDTFVITHRSDLMFKYIKNLPDNIDFRTGSDIYLFNVKKLTDNVTFNNNGDVFIDSIVDIPNSVKFNNNGDVWLYSIEFLPKNKYKIFNNTGTVYYNYSYGKIMKEFDPSKKVNVKKTAAPESYTDISDVNDTVFRDLQDWHLEDKNLPFLKDEFIGEDTHKYKQPPKVFRELDSFPDQAYDGVQASKKLSNNIDLSNDSINPYDISPFNEINLYPSKRKDNYDYKKRNTKGDEEMLFEKGLHQTIERPETDRNLIPYASNFLNRRKVSNLHTLSWTSGKDSWKDILFNYDKERGQQIDFFESSPNENNALSPIVMKQPWNTENIVLDTDQDSLKDKSLDWNTKQNLQLWI